MYRSLLLLGAACALSATAHAGDKFEIKPGKWKSEVTMEMSIVAKGMAMNQPARTTSHEYCVTADEASFTPEDFAKQINESSDMGDTECEVSDVQADHPRLSYTITCSMQGMEMVMENDFTVSADGKSGTGTGTSSIDRDGMQMDTKSKTVQTYLGDC